MVFKVKNIIRFRKEILEMVYKGMASLGVRFIKTELTKIDRLERK